jgi:hypothetical protein
MAWEINVSVLAFIVFLSDISYILIKTTDFTRKQAFETVLSSTSTTCTNKKLKVIRAENLRITVLGCDTV